jgi:DNA-directed RNA polymerase specialized sigma24 family protein
MHLAEINRCLRWELGSIPRGNLEALIIEHLDTLRELQALGRVEFQLIYMLVYGYSQKEICQHTKLNPRTVARRLQRIRQEMLRS